MSADVTVATTVNGSPWRLAVPATETLAELLRDRLGLRGVKVSCGLQVCGACTVLLDGRAISACTTLAAESDGRAVLTVEGLAGAGGDLHPLQRAFIEHGALQCGYCTPGMLMTAHALLEREEEPDAEDVRRELRGSICRCTGYRPIVEAILAAARELRK